MRSNNSLPLFVALVAFVPSTGSSLAPELPSIEDILFERGVVIAVPVKCETPCYVCGTSENDGRVGALCRARYNVTSDAS